MIKVGILSFRSPENRASAEELSMVKEARNLGYRCQIYRAKKFKMVYDQNSPWIFYDKKPFKKCDVMITRPSILSDVDIYTSLIEQMELSGMLLFNRYDSILKCKNKIKTMQILDHYSIPIPKTVLVSRQDDLLGAVKLLGGFPIIVKRPVGSFGAGVMIVESMRALKSILLWDQPMYLFQEYVKYSKGKDLRVFVVNGKVIGSMMREAKKGEFRSNIELGAKGKNIEITEEEVSISLRAVQALNLSYGGVDIIRSKNGPVILEVNSNPGFKELERACQINVSKALVEYAAELAERHKQ